MTVVYVKAVHLFVEQWINSYRHMDFQHSAFSTEFPMNLLLYIIESYANGNCLDLYLHIPYTIVYQNPKHKPTCIPILYYRAPQANLIQNRLNKEKK